MNTNTLLYNEHLYQKSTCILVSLRSCRALTLTWKIKFNILIYLGFQKKKNEYSFAKLVSEYFKALSFESLWWF